LHGIDDAIKRLALRFQNESELNAVFLGNPYDNHVVGFRFYSQRSCVITYKNVPQNDPALEEWMNRCLDLNAAYKKEDGYNGKNFDAFFTLQGTALIDYCDKYHITHILTSETDTTIEEKYKPLEFSILDREGV